MQQRVGLSLLLALNVGAACSKTAEQQGTPTPPSSEGVAPSSPRPAGTWGLVEGGPGFAAQTLAVRKEPSDAREINDPAGRQKKSANWVATVYRGEQLTPLKMEGDWLQIRLSDGKEGWVKGDAVVNGKVELATVFEKTKVFNRPDLLALNAARQIEPGTLLFVLRNKDQFSEINSGASQTAWVLTGVLTLDAREVEVAKLINRARALRGTAEADAPLELAKSQFADSRLVQQTLLPPPADPNAPAPESAAPAAGEVPPVPPVGAPAPPPADALKPQ